MPVGSRIRLKDRFAVRLRQRFAIISDLDLSTHRLCSDHNSNTGPAVSLCVCDEISNDLTYAASVSHDRGRSVCIDRNTRINGLNRADCFDREIDRARINNEVSRVRTCHHEEVLDDTRYLETLVGDDVEEFTALVFFDGGR